VGHRSAVGPTVSLSLPQAADDENWQLVVSATNIDTHRRAKRGNALQPSAMKNQHRPTRPGADRQIERMLRNMLDHWPEERCESAGRVCKAGPRADKSPRAADCWVRGRQGKRQRLIERRDLLRRRGRRGDGSVIRTKRTNGTAREGVVDWATGSVVSCSLEVFSASLGRRWG
jgi:hypothetical protein